MSYSKVVRLALALVVAGALIVPLLPSAKAPPLVPYEAWGLAKTSAGASIGLNQPIRTFIDGVDYSNLSSTFRADGSYQLQIAGNWYIGANSETPMLKEGGDPNDAIMFAHGDMTATGTVFQQIAPWVSAGFQNLDLNEGVAASQPALIKIQTVTTRSTDGLSQYAYICNPTASPVDLLMYYFEKDLPGNFAGPQVRLAGIVGAGQKIFGDMRSTTYVNNSGDALKLVFDTTPGVGAPNAGADIVVDRVEFNASSGGALTWEPGNTIMTDAPAPGIGQEIHRQTNCADANQGSDFSTGPETGRPTSPQVLVFTPNGGERWTGGTPHAITFNLIDGQDADTALLVNISYSTDSGVTYPNVIAAPFNPANNVEPHSFSWTTPSIDTNTARVLVCARDTTALLGCDASNADFSIDSTFPQVISRTPGPGATGVLLNQDIVVGFSEGMDQASVASAFSLSPNNAGTLSFAWAGSTVTVSHSLPFGGGQSYQVTISTLAKDLSDPGKNLIPSVSWSFLTFQNNAPTASITTPAGGECWSGGFSHTIVWTMNDIETLPANLVVYLNYTSGAGNGLIAGPLTGATSHAWPTPTSLNANDVSIVLTVIDEAGVKRTVQSPLITIDSTAPTMTSTPADGATGIAKLAQISLRFTEVMDRGFVLAGGVVISPGVTSPAYNWNTAGDTLTISHSEPFRAATQYTVTIFGAKDACTPGTALAGSTSFQFTTAANTLPTAQILTPAGGAVFAPGDTIAITWTMGDGAETPESSLVVFLNYTSSAGSGTISGRLVGQTSFTSWKAPNIESSNVKVNLTVIDSDGGKFFAESGPFAIKAGGLDLVVTGIILAIILAVIIGLLLFFLVFRKRRKKDVVVVVPPPPVAPARVAAPPVARAPPPRPAPPVGPPSMGTKECPSCGTIVDGKDVECFMCGHKF